MTNRKRPTNGNERRSVDVARLRADVDRYMLKHGLRWTEQRRLIVDTFFSAEDHISIESLLKQVQQIDSRVGNATVYRTMKMLSASGVAQEHKFGDRFARYEASDANAHHDHLVCIGCGKITEFEEPQVEALQTKVAKRHGFVVSAHKHELYGFCADCQEQGRG